MKLIKENIYTVDKNGNSLKIKNKSLSRKKLKKRLKQKLKENFDWSQKVNDIVLNVLDNKLKEKYEKFCNDRECNKNISNEEKYYVSEILKKLQWKL